MEGTDSDVGEERALLLPGGVSALGAEASLGPPLIAPPNLDEETLPDFKRPRGQMVEEVALQ